MKILFSNSVPRLIGIGIVLLLALVATTQAQAATYFFHNDHLGTPQTVTDEAQQTVWQAERRPFGKVPETANQIEQNVRFPGQYFDSETGLHYNYYRDYDPSLGRYIQSDPIGLAGGLNTYGYVGGNPLMYYDPLGLWAFGDPLPQRVVDFSAGFGDALLLGFGDDLRDLAGVDGGVDQCSGAYQAGSWGSFAFGGARIAYAGVVKGYSVVAPSGAAASAFRSRAKTFFRGGAGKNWRPVDVSKYPNDAALRAAAGRSNTGVNAYGAGVAAAGAAGGSGCGCP